jgi:hypothetical protein
VEDDSPPVGLSEDEAYDPPSWVRPVIGLSVGLLLLSCLLLTVLSLALVTGAEDTGKAWGFWGDTRVLGALLLAAAVLIGLGLLLFLRHDDNSLALMLLGLMVLSGTMLWGIVHYTRSGGPLVMLLMLLVPLMAMFGLQSTEVRRWWFLSIDRGDGP